MNMHNTRPWLSIVATLGVMLLLLGVAPITSVAGKTVHRPISEFLSAQGKQCDGTGGCYLYVPPDPNFMGWSTDMDKTPVLFAGVDYAGLAAEAYYSGKKPQIEGTVTERPLADGRAEIRVQLHTKGANVWVMELDFNGDVLAQIASGPTLFGHRPVEVQAGKGQALGDSFLDAVFINPKPGDPLPDLVSVNDKGLFEFVSFHVSATGPLTEQFGVREGTPGRATITQVGLYKPHVEGGVDGDNFPVENIKLQVIGK